MRRVTWFSILHKHLLKEGGTNELEVVHRFLNQKLKNVSTKNNSLYQRNGYPDRKLELQVHQVVEVRVKGGKLEMRLHQLLDLDPELWQDQDQHGVAGVVVGVAGVVVVKHFFVFIKIL